MRSFYTSRIDFKSRTNYLAILTTFILLFTALDNAKAQIDSIVPVKRSHVNNILKFNPAGLLFGSISIQDEVYFNGKVSGAIGFNLALSELFFPKTFSKNDSGVQLKDLSLTGFSITPECRYYVSSNAPKGFYIAPYLRFSHYTVSNAVVNYLSDDTLKTVVMGGKYTQTAGGIMIGSQSRSGSHIVLDWWILGLAGGSGKFEFNAPGTYKEKELADFKDKIDDVSKSLNADESTTKNINIKYSLPISLRMGFAIGYIF